MTKVAVVGLGAMGQRIARRLVVAGNDLVVWNRTSERAAPLVDLGATAAKTPAQAASEAEVVITMVADPAALEAVTKGSDGIGQGVDPSTTVIDMSTVGPAAVRWLASALPPGTPLLDAPVLGSLPEAESGSLTIFVGGPRALVDRWRPLLAELGAPIHVGDLGSGAAAKLVANASLFGILGVLGEAVALARMLGLADEVAFEVLSATPLASQAERRRPSIESGDYPPRFLLSLARKDVDLIAAAAGQSDLRVLTAVRAWLADAEAAGRGGDDYSAALAHILDANAAASSAEPDR
jgi:3-hydroxyisobutyrate dehydrogenase-like beta-hydroxyacid dehydrogenase